MKVTTSFTLIGCLMTWTVPVAAQDRMESTPGPIGRAIAREAVRLTADPAEGSADARWSRVRKLASGTEIVVAVEGSPPGERYVVRADESVLTVLNLVDPPLPAFARDVLRGVVSSHPEYFSAAQRGGVIVLEKSLRLSLDGVFVGDRKVADLGQVVENVSRHQVAEIKTRQQGRGLWGHVGPLGGWFLGAMSGGLVAGIACRAAVGRDRCDTGAFGKGALVGGIVGGVHGFRAAHRETEDVIYRAP
jgi:hypothetical protein